MNEQLIESLACWIYESQPSSRVAGRWQDAPIAVTPWYRLTAREMLRRVETGHVKLPEGFAGMAPSADGGCK